MDKRIYEAEAVREMMKTPGMVIMRQKIADRVSMLRDMWWQGSPDEVEKYRQEAKALRKFLDLAGRVMMEGEIARRKAEAPSPNENVGQG